MISAKERSAIIQSLAAGLVPAIGVQHLQVGRNDEVQALVRDLDQVASGGASCRFVVGRYGSGKTFFLSLIRYVALQRKFVVRRPTSRPNADFKEARDRRGPSFGN